MICQMNSLDLYFLGIGICPFDTESEFLYKPLITRSLFFSGYRIVTDIFYFSTIGCAISCRRIVVDKLLGDIGLLGSRGAFLSSGWGD